MLLPILILKLDVNKCLDNPVDLANQKGLRAWAGKFIDAIIAKFCYLPVAETTFAKINYFPNCLQQNLSQTYTGKYIYVFASQMQKSQQHFQEMTPVERQGLLRQLKLDYSLIILPQIKHSKIKLINLSIPYFMLIFLCPK